MASDKSASTALVRKRTAMELMPPPPPPKRIKRPKEVLDEETYTEALSKIIARDYFPGLLESETQHEYLDALASKDAEWISSAKLRLELVMTPGRRRGRIGTSLDTPIRASSQTPLQTPSGLSTIQDTPRTVASSQARPDVEVDTSLSLGAFQAKYTSEDNESFYKLVDKQNQKRAEKYAWLWRGNMLPSKMRLKQDEVQGRLIESGRLEHIKSKRTKLLENGDNRPAQPDTWVSAPNNALMFMPDGVEETPDPDTGKLVVHENTRLPPTASEGGEPTRPPSPSLSAVRDAIAGKKRAEYAESSDGDEAPRQPTTPRVNGYAYVNELSHLATLRNLAGGDDTPNPFALKESSRREALHHRLVDRIAQSKRTASTQGFTGKVEDTPTPRLPSTPRGSANLTPAAQRLWGKIGSQTPKASSFESSTPLRRTPLVKKR